MTSTSPTFSKLKHNFANRLLDLMYKNGYETNRKPFFVDVSRFAKEIECSETMTRRYLSAMALPNYQTIDLMADIFKVDAFWLYSGANPNQLIDVPLLTLLMQKLRPALREANDEEFAAIIAYLIDIYNRAQQINYADDIEKHRIVQWMLDELLQAHKNPIKSLGQL